MTSTRPERAPVIGPDWSRLRQLDARFDEVAAAFGFRVVREPGAYVSYQGDDVIRIAPYADLDPDDSVAQMVVHELCHFAVEGSSSRTQWDWGLGNQDGRDEPSELAAIRMQAALLEPFELRAVLAPTTDFRHDYDRLPADPFMPASVVSDRARIGLERLQAEPGFTTLSAALREVQALSLA